MVLRVNIDYIHGKLTCHELFNIGGPAKQKVKRSSPSHILADFREKKNLKGIVNGRPNYIYCLI